MLFFLSGTDKSSLKKGEGANGVIPVSSFSQYVLYDSL